MAKTAKKKKIAKCTECGGPRRGPKAHAPGCSIAAAAKAAKAGKGKKKAKAKVVEAAPRTGVSMADLRAMSPQELMKLRDRIVKVLTSKVGDIDTQIKELQDLKKSVGAMTAKK